MSVYQATKLPVLSLPFGASNFPYQLLDILKDYEKVYLWMDFDQMGQMNVENFASKIGSSKTIIIREKSKEEIQKLTGQ